MSIPTFDKDPDAFLDWRFPWDDWLAEGETISSFTVTAPSGLVHDAQHAEHPDTEAGGIVTAWIGGGTAGKTYTVTCHIVTNAGRIDDRSMILSVTQR